jgi:hypothetical protein
MEALKVSGRRIADAVHDSAGNMCSLNHVVVRTTAAARLGMAGSYRRALFGAYVRPDEHAVFFLADARHHKEEDMKI